MSSLYKIYGKDNCVYCRAAKTLLESKKLQYIEYKVGNDVTKEFLLEIVPGAKTVPQIFHGDEYVGGYEKLVERLNANDTAKFLSE